MIRAISISNHEAFSHCPNVLSDQCNKFSYLKSLGTITGFALVLIHIIRLSSRYFFHRISWVTLCVNCCYVPIDSLYKLTHEVIKDLLGCTESIDTVQGGRWCCALDAERLNVPGLLANLIQFFSKLLSLVIHKVGLKWFSQPHRDSKMISEQPKVALKIPLRVQSWVASRNRS